MTMTNMTRIHSGGDALHVQRKAGKSMVLFRQELGDVLRNARRSQGRTLRQVSSDARVSLGYLSEIERGQKEASSELLVSVTDALGLPLSYVLREVSDRIALTEGVTVPDTIPDSLADETGTLVGAR
jgi:transcriptional regulator with XRE-family HTH domain